MKYKNGTGLTSAHSNMTAQNIFKTPNAFSHTEYIWIRSQLSCTYAYIRYSLCFLH